eukprot:TRINITY_DN6620_c0_g1_i5.p1 TRINITY_DN6620_c0_g1~~TRINITY_DN6620_c0_g1_i5.p1  ORF type:complete len:205 (-),score=53.84 TRINITY_DN6620_c0_g1_i5:131-745(-)
MDTKALQLQSQHSQIIQLNDDVKNLLAKLIALEKENDVLASKLNLKRMKVFVDSHVRTIVKRRKLKETNQDLGSSRSLYRHEDDCNEDVCSSGSLEHEYGDDSKNKREFPSLQFLEMGCDSGADGSSHQPLHDRGQRTTRDHQCNFQNQYPTIRHRTTEAMSATSKTTATTETATTTATTTATSKTATTTTRRPQQSKTRFTYS